MNQKTRLRRIVNVMATKGRDGDQTIATMSDDALAVLITGRPDARASDLSDQDLERIAGD